MVRDSSVAIPTRYGLDGLGIESRWERDFPHPFRPNLLPTQPPFNGYRVFPGGKVAGVWRWPPTPSSAEVKERVELYLYSTFGPSWPVIRWTLPFTFTNEVGTVKNDHKPLQCSFRAQWRSEKVNITPTNALFFNLCAPSLTWLLHVSAACRWQDNAATRSSYVKERDNYMIVCLFVLREISTIMNVPFFPRKRSKSRLLVLPRVTQSTLSATRSVI